MKLPTVDSSFSSRVGGRYAVTLAPWLWSIPVMVFLIPLANSSAWDGPVALLTQIGYSGLAWSGFGAVLYIAHKTVLADGEENPASIPTMLVIGGLAGLARSLILGDWFTFFTLEGDYNLSKVVNAVFTGWAWLLMTALIVSGAHMFSDQYAILIKQQSDLLVNSEEWLHQVRNQRERIIAALRPELDQRWSNIRQKIYAMSNASGQEWEQIAREIALSSRETVHSLATSLRAPRNTEFDSRGPVREAFYLITRTPIIDSIRPSLTMLALGTLPIVRLLGLENGLRIVTNAAALTYVILELVAIIIKKSPNLGLFIYTMGVALSGGLSFLLLPTLQNNGLTRNAAFAFAFLGGVISLVSVPIYSYVALTRNRRDEALQSLQRQNAILTSLNKANSQQSFEAAIDISSYLQVSVSNAIGNAQAMINDGIAHGDLQAARAGVAVIETIYSNIFGKYSEAEELQLEDEVAELVNAAKNSILITYSINAPKASREISRRVLVIINELVNQATQSKALRMHFTIADSENGIDFLCEANLPSTWVLQSPITTEVLDTATQKSWEIENTQSGSSLRGFIKTPPTSSVD